MELTETQITDTILNTVVQPFPIYFDCNDYHVMLYFKQNPEYESIEAFIQEREEGDPYIRAILTRPDQTQVDHINDQSTVDRLKARKRKREVYYTKIQYERSEQRGKPHIVLKFTSFRGEDIVFDFYAAAKASAKRTGLIDPGGHSMNISLPVMYPEKTTLAGPKSKIILNGVKYEMPVKVWIPLLFKGMKGYYSELFSIGVIRAGKEQLKVLQVPQTISPGEKWVYESGGEMESYEIMGIEDDLLIIKKHNQVITARLSGGSFEIIRILNIFDLTKNHKSEYTIEFSPALPISLEPISSQKTEVNFSISINEHLTLITGIVKRDKTGNTTKFLLAPLNPEWCTKRPVSVMIEQQENLFLINTEIANKA